MKLLLIVLGSMVACNTDGGAKKTAMVTHVVDGDTVDLDSGERIRYLMIDSTELGSDDCWSSEARRANSDLVLGKLVELEFDVDREDVFGRSLAYVTVDGVEVNTRLVERGFACVLHIPPNGNNRLDEFEALETAARDASRGMWGQCMEVTCD